MSVTTAYRRLQQRLPARLHPALLALHALPMRLFYWGRVHYCPLCDGNLRTFQAHGPARRPNALCPVCFSLERHRAAWLFLQRRTDLFKGQSRRLLHFAPEPVLQARLARLPHLDYVTADLDNPRADEVVDITAMQFPDCSFDAIYCSHVLEHVPADRQAIRELWRVLRPGGWALLVVPIGADLTVEDPAVTDPSGRLRRFGQADHVRIYGRDFQDRLREAGFDVDVVTAGQLVSREEAGTFGLSPSESLFYCVKPHDSHN